MKKSSIKGETWQKKQQTYHLLPHHCCTGETIQRKMFTWDPSLLFLGGQWKEFSFVIVFAFTLLSPFFFPFSFPPPSLHLPPSLLLFFFSFFPKSNFSNLMSPAMNSTNKSLCTWNCLKIPYAATCTTYKILVFQTLSLCIFWQIGKYTGVFFLFFYILKFIKFTKRNLRSFKHLGSTNTILV